MKMWSINVITLLLFCYARPLTGKVYFVSENFNNTLHWDPPESAALQGKLLYTVQYKSDDMDQFQIKKDCQNITALSCDLTAETASFYDIQYEARVFVDSACYGRTTRFKPLAETVFGPPKWSINTTASSLLINVSLPLGPDGISIADIINRSTNGHSKSVIIYTVVITEPEWAAQVATTINGSFNISLTRQAAKYCGYVVYNTLSDYGRPDSQKAPFCAELPGCYRKLLPWLLIGVTFPAVIILMLALYVWNYAKGGKRNNMPQSLVANLHAQQNVLPDPYEEVNINTAIMVRTSPKVPSGYSPQDVILQDCPTLSRQDTSSQSSEIYSVVAVDVPAGEKLNIQRPLTDNSHPVAFSGETCNAAGTIPTLAMTDILDAPESNAAKPLMLDIVRHADGQLMLSSLISLLQSRRGDEAAPLPSEKKPLLSDLILIDTKMEEPSLASLQSCDSSEWSDSGCDDSNANTPTVYSPSQAIFQSGYKQNWMPGIFLGDGRCETVSNS